MLEVKGFNNCLTAQSLHFRKLKSNGTADRWSSCLETLEEIKGGELSPSVESIVVVHRGRLTNTV